MKQKKSNCSGKIFGLGSTEVEKLLMLKLVGRTAAMPTTTDVSTTTAAVATRETTYVATTSAVNYKTIIITNRAVDTSTSVTTAVVTPAAIAT